LDMSTIHDKRFISGTCSFGLEACFLKERRFEGEERQLPARNSECLPTSLCEKTDPFKQFCLCVFDWLL
jgi:hypothetical protein